MRSRLLTLLAIASVTQFSFAEKRTIPCKTPAIATSCYVAHGRLTFGDGTPFTRIWLIGTHRMLRLYSDALNFRAERALGDADDGAPYVPENVKRSEGPNVQAFYADFELCPLEPHIPGHMQAACIESATHLVIKKP